MQPAQQVPGNRKENMATDFGDFEVTVERKPVAGITQGDIPEKLAQHLAANYKKALEGEDHELRLKARDEKTAKQLAGYARAWGARQEPKLRITKLPNGQRLPENVARLNVALDADVPEDKRPGRKAAK